MNHPITMREKPWPIFRGDELATKLHSLAEKEEITYAFLPSPETNFLRYLPAGLTEEIASWSPDTCRLIDPATSGEVPDIIIATTHVSDREPSWLWQIRKKYGHQPLIALWMWDNHFDHETNLKSAILGDLVFPSHHYDATYLSSPVSLLSSHIPACSAQWTRREAEDLYSRFGDRARKHNLLVNYAKYDFAEKRNAFIDTIGENIAEAEMLLMDQADRSRYFSMNRADRFAEWSAYKTTIIIPMVNDLSTRFFDALLAGMVPIVPESIPDVDNLLSRQQQSALGIVRLPSYEIEDVKAAVSQAFSIYDERGINGARARHQFVLNNHMTINRISSILLTLHLHATNQIRIEFQDGPWGLGLYEVR
ncbi:MAG: hypothetical protein Q8M11_12945 [Sulfuritalea sp.]|nr:hypothetical protein [Sulfuritalea sp.]MDP1984338.1 hypothetical protein [Sulfuritalea sp.]